MKEKFQVTLVSSWEQSVTSTFKSLEASLHVFNKILQTFLEWTRRKKIKKININWEWGNGGERDTGDRNRRHRWGDHPLCSRFHWWKVGDLGLQYRKLLHFRCLPFYNLFDLFSFLGFLLSYFFLIIELKIFFTPDFPAKTIVVGTNIILG